MKRTMAIALMILAVGCSKKKEGDAAKGEAPKAADKPAETGAELPESVMAWMPKGAAEAWQGAWNGRLTLEMGGTHSMAGDPAAIEIKGDKATVFDGKKETQLGFVVESPCTVRFDQALTEGSMKGGTAYHHKQFAMKDGKLLVGEGAAGYRKGKTAIVCTTGSQGGIYVVPEAGDCQVWEKKFDKWESKKDTCAWSQADGKDVLTLGTGDWASKVTADGDVLADDQFMQFVKEGLHEKAADYAAAKEWVTAKVKADDPGEQAKAAGGKVGDTSTIVSLNASYAADKSLKGKPLEIKAQFLNASSSTSSSGGTTTNFYSAQLVDSKDQTKFTLSCETKEEVKGFKQFDKVIAKGTIGDSFGKPSLEDCTLTKAR